MCYTYSCDQGMKIYYDHHNIIFIFAPSKMMKKHVGDRLLRWSTKLLEYRDKIEQIEEAQNVWADLISRWGGKVHQVAIMHSAKRFTSFKRKISNLTQNLPNTNHEVFGLIWSTIDEISIEQSKHAVPAAAVKTSNDVWLLDNRIWIPQQATQLILRLMVISHCGAKGHRGMHVMESHLRKFFAISGLVNRIRMFCQKCLLCLHVKGGAIIPRPFSPTYHTHERNQALHWDYLSLLAAHNEATHFVDLVACDRPTAAVAAAAILDWYSRFGIAPVWISDSGSHFKNQVVADLNKRLKARQEYILAYSPWKNGTIERVNRDIKQLVYTTGLTYFRSCCLA
ncbi:Hypothetical protein PHPALM_3169 [Phytophthora palmivora]|uniref:Integrase catalytic domain-containing protein n=1 Tax=Phytophthora palmivora TaxID=4796 RepID=A0A2P4YN26_9STRA|nr:Hypothetical protein PHPALM_3169 [Phytophthora palmivora]